MSHQDADTGPVNILLCTLGASWAVVPEILGWIGPNLLDLYAHHPQRPLLDRLRAQRQIKPPDELWICTTEGQQTHHSLEQLQRWWQLMGAPLPLRIWTAAHTNQLASQDECAHIRELTLRATLLASELAAGGGQLILSLAGGRKTMSADLQTAGNIFGAQAMLHVVGPEPMPGALQGRTPEDSARQPQLFSRPLPEELAKAIMPLVASTGQRSELLDLELDGRTVSSHDFPLPEPAPNQIISWELPPDKDALFQELQKRQQQSSDLMGNFLAQIAARENHENWRSLYRLTPGHIQRLRQTPLSAHHCQWLQALPKADLHRHIGGCLDLSMQRQVAQAIWAQMTLPQREHSLQSVQTLLDTPAWPWEWPQTLKEPGPLRAERTAALLLHASEKQLQHNLFTVTEPRIGLKTHPKGFAAYERPGELSGSALLCHSAAIAAYAAAIVEQAHAEGLRYLELRGSPHKYRPDAPLEFLRELHEALRQTGAITSSTSVGDSFAAPPLRIGFIWILDRRQPDNVQQNIKQAVQAHKRLEGFVLGLDLAGDEGTNNPEELAPAFVSAFAECLPITIHAGEGESAKNIWQATYHLHADRIGHGLTLASHSALLARFRDRGICLELCPTSNREVVGFRDPLIPASVDYPIYPLRQFLEQGLSVTLCTDNPGISRTTLTDEYLTAARMCEKGLSQWEALALIRQSFVHAFLPSAEREALQKSADQEIFRLLSHFE
jgi:adenosine deaminase